MSFISLLPLVLAVLHAPLHNIAHGWDKLSLILLSVGCFTVFESNTDKAWSYINHAMTFCGIHTFTSKHSCGREVHRSKWPQEIRWEDVVTCCFYLGLKNSWGKAPSQTAYSLCPGGFMCSTAAASQNYMQKTDPQYSSKLIKLRKSSFFQYEFRVCDRNLSSLDAVLTVFVAIC